MPLPKSAAELFDELAERMVCLHRALNVYCLNDVLGKLYSAEGWHCAGNVYGICQEFFVFTAPAFVSWSVATPSEHVSECGSIKQ